MKRNLKRIISIILVGILSIGVLPQTGTQAAEQTPGNYVIQLVIDGLSNELFDELKAGGAQTPNIDWLMEQGTRVTDVNTVTPAQGASLAAAMTGASSGANSFPFSYYHRDKGKLETATGMYFMNAQTIFKKIRKEDENIHMLAAGWNRQTQSIKSNDGVNPTDEEHKLIEYEKNDKLIPFTDIADDIIEAIQKETTPRYMTGYSNDLKISLWKSEFTEAKRETAVETLNAIDVKIGEIIKAAEEKGILDNTTFLVSSLLTLSASEKKLPVADLATSLTYDLNLKTQVAVSNLIIDPNTKIVLVGTIQPFVQMYFITDNERPEDNITEEEKELVLEYLQDKDNAWGSKIHSVVSTEEYGWTDDGYKFGDYIIIPENGMSFSSSAANLMMPGNQLEQTVFCVASGAEVPQGSTVVDTEQEHSIMDFAPTICSWLGVAAPEQAEGSAWEFSTDAASAPVIALDQPDSHYQLTYESLLRLQGSVSQGTETLTVNGETVELNDSAFEHSISLQEGINIIDLAAANAAGNQTHKYLTVDYRPLPEKEALNRVVYINFDGFADYYFDEAEKQGLVPVLSKIKNEDGIYFDNAYTNIPSITNPMQNAIIAGAPPIITDNYRKYFNKEQNVVLTQEDGTRAENLAEAAVRQGLSVISINQFITEERGTAANEPYSAYVTSSYGASGYSDGAARFDELIKLVEEGKAGKLTFEELPQFIMLYADDLDGLGHNHNAHTYGTPRVYTEEDRMDLVLRRLQKLDEKIGEMIEAFENAGLMETTTFILTTDHGMTQYGGMETAEEETAYSQLEDLRASISALGEGFNCEVLTYHETPAEDTDIVLVTYGGLTANLSYVNEYDRDVINEKNQKIIEMVQQKPYFGAVMEPEEMQERGTKMGFADLIISPKTPYHFSEDTNAIRAQGNHDSILESSQKIASFMWGGNVEKGVTYTDRIYNYEFTAQMAALMGINAPLDSIGTVRNDILSGIRVEESSAGSMEAETAVLGGSASEENGLVVLENDGTTAAEAEWTDLPESSRIVFRYPADTTGTLALYHNGEFVRNIFFPSYSGVEMSEKIVNLSLEEGDSIKLTCERSKGNTPVSLDSMYFTLNETVEEEPEVPTDPDTPTTPENPDTPDNPGTPSNPVYADAVIEVQDENGAAVAGAKVSLYDQDYELIAELETDENGRAYQEKLAKGTYYAVLDGEEKEFEISSDQTVTVTLVQKTQTEQQQFDDIGNHWAKEDILSMTDMGLFAGTGENKFSPDVTMSRAMLVSVLYRLNEMEPETFGVVCEEPREFSDVEAGTWYAESVAWAGGSGIVSGIGENIFEPDTSITREQLAVILYQYLQRIGMELENNPVDFNNFADSNTVASWSYDAMQYCVNVGLISGKDHNMLDPQGLLTRAEAASVLSRLIQQINNTVSE